MSLAVLSLDVMQWGHLLFVVMWVVSSWVVVSRVHLSFDVMS